MVIQSFLVVTGLTDVRLPLYVDFINTSIEVVSWRIPSVRVSPLVVKTHSRMCGRRTDQERRLNASTAMLADCIFLFTDADAVSFVNSVNTAVRVCIYLLMCRISVMCRLLVMCRSLVMDPKKVYLWWWIQWVPGPSIQLLAPRRQHPHWSFHQSAGYCLPVVTRELRTPTWTFWAILHDHWWWV